MYKTQTIEIELPTGNDLSAADLQVLRAACEQLVMQSCQPAANSAAQIQAMSAEGWQVQSNLTWIARAERERESEEAVGETQSQALCRLCQMTGLHAVDGCP